jgi:all-trans-retinol 13,14-reductase
MISGFHAAAAVLGRNLDAEIRAGTVLGEQHDRKDDPENWDPLAAAKALAIRTPRGHLAQPSV